MIGMPDCRIRGAVLGAVAPYGDIGAVSVMCDEHPYLICDPFGHPLWQGRATTGAEVFICHECSRILDKRRVP